MTTIQSLSGKRICILGYGREGKAMTQALEDHAKNCEITIADKDGSVDVPEKYSRQLGVDWLKDLDRFDVVIKSPGIPPNELPTTHYSLPPHRSSSTRLKTPAQ